MKRQYESHSHANKRVKPAEFVGEYDNVIVPENEEARNEIDSSVRPPLTDAPHDWTPHPLPTFPQGFLDGEFVLPVHQTRLSERLNKHPRDNRIVFDEAPHLYYVDNIQCSWSVTTLCHKFSEHFDEEAAIAMMRRSKNWPRAQYAKSDMSLWRVCIESVLHALQNNSENSYSMLQTTEKMLTMVEADISEVDVNALCALLQEMKRSSQGLAVAVQDTISESITEVAFTDDEIKLSWDRNRQDAANRGTWFHLQAELWLNRDHCYFGGPEMGLFLKYIKGHLEPLHVQVYRTEWEVYGEEEDLAGSIDFVGQYTEGPLKGQLFLGDWKRSRDLRKKGRHVMGKMMTGSMSPMSDCAKAHYTLQLNCYAFLIEKYYGKKVGRMEVICVHEDNGNKPYWFEVPRMTSVTSFLMAYQRKECAEAVLNRYEAKMQADDNAFPALLQ